MAESTQGETSIHHQSETETGMSDSPNRRTAAGRSSASDWDMNRTKPSDDGADQKPGSGKPPAQQAPQDGNR